MSDGLHNYTFDAENRIIKVDGGNTATYVYDADGHRVQKTSATGNVSDPAGTWIFFYDQSGRWVQKFNSPGNTFVQGHIFAAGRHLASVGGWTTFSHSDWVGTERLRLGMGGIPYQTESCTSLPFGDGLNCAGSDVDPLHFTGKERDAATGLDNFGARYNSSSFGRFMSPDPYNAGASIDAPQSWNAYSYVLNNPLNSVDPDGLDCVYLNDAHTSGQVVRGDCINEGGKNDNGIFVDGKVDINAGGTISGTGNGDSLAFSYTPEGATSETIHSENVGEASSPSGDDLPPTNEDYMKAIHDSFAKFPNVCSASANASFGFGARVAFRAQYTVTENRPDSFTYGGQVTLLKGSTSKNDGATGGRANFTFMGNGNGNASLGVNGRVAGVVGVTFGTDDGNHLTSLGVNARLGKFASVGASIDPRLHKFYSCPQ
jgi:RHS repeat-associated protein